MQSRAVFGGVDRLAAEHGLGLVQHLAFLRQLQQGLHDGGRHPLTGCVHLKTGRFKLQAGAARIVWQQFAQMQLGAMGQGLQLLPSGTLFRAGEGGHGAWIVNRVKEGLASRATALKAPPSGRGPRPLAPSG